jgi:hypothetical protein
MFDALHIAATGRPEDPAIVGAALLSAAKGEVAAMCSPIGREAALSVLPAETLCQVLAGEPDELIAALLHRQDWPWKESLLEHLGPVRRHRILSASRARAFIAWSSRRPQFDEALMQGVLLRATRTPAQVLVKSTVPGLRGVAASVQRCIRHLTAHIRARAHP